MFSTKDIQNQVQREAQRVSTNMSGMTELQKAVQKEMNRIVRFITDKQSQGFSFVKLPNLEFEKTKARSKQLKMLKSYTPEKLMKEHSEWIDPTTGDIYEKEEGIMQEAKYAQENHRSYNKNYTTTDYKPVIRLPGTADISIINAIRDRLQALPTERRVKGGPMDLSEEVNSVLSAFDDMVGQSDDESALINYLYRNEYDIAKNCEQITWDSNRENIQHAFYKLIIIFNNGQALTSEQAMQYEDEFGDGLEGYDFDY